MQLQRPEDWYAQASAPIYQDQLVQEQLHCDRMRLFIHQGIIDKMTQIFRHNLRAHIDEAPEKHLLYYDN